MVAVEHRSTRPFEVIPAIDLLGGQVVRLQKGDYQRRTIFDTDPREVARGYWDAGASALHVIDLDAAKSGQRSAEHERILADLVAAKPAGTLIELGGGFRSDDQVAAAIGLGVDRVLLGTAAFIDSTFLDRMVARFSGHVVVCADCLGRTVRVNGWTGDTAIQVTEAVSAMSERGVTGFLVTVIERDGMMNGPDVELMAQLRPLTGGLLLASGGVHRAEDIPALRATGADGVVVGRALLDGSVRFADLVSHAQD